MKQILTGKEIADVELSTNSPHLMYDFARAIEAKILEKIGETVAVCDTKNRIKFVGDDDCHRYASAPNWLEVGTPLYAIPFIKEGE